MSASRTQDKTAYLVDSLNDLLGELDLPFELESPQDLTPSLLLAILESILRSRLPILPAVRESRTFSSKVHAMKIFIGVLESDIIRFDVGLSDVDPRKLARGEWDEVVFVGELLCWLARRTGIMPAIGLYDTADDPLPILRGHQAPPLSPLCMDAPRRSDPYAASSSATGFTTSTTSSSARASSATIKPDRRQSTAKQENILARVRRVAENLPLHNTKRPPSPPRQLPTKMPTMPFDDILGPLTSTSPQKKPGFRRTGYIEPVDEDLELETYHAQVAALKQQSQAAAPRTPSPSPGARKSFSDLQYLLRDPYTSVELTVILMNKRAKLLEELARIYALP